MNRAIATAGLLATITLSIGCAHDHHVGMRVEGRGVAPDNDRDGVSDNVDQCLATPPRHSVDASGCSSDADGDGIANAQDRCPDTDEGLDVDQRGCAIDADADGVLAAADRCPNTPPKAEVDGDGCAVTTASPSLPTLNEVHFRFDSAELSEAAAEPIGKIVDAVQARPGAQLQVTGYTDDVGSAGYNLGLAMRRAQAVIERLIAEGVAGERLSALARGQADPVAPNDTESGRARNRRVEVTLQD